MVRGGPSAGRANEARPRPSPVPRQVRAAARRDVPSAALRTGAVRPRPVRRLGHDARGGERPRPRSSRLRRLGVQLPAHAGEDPRVRAREAGARASDGARSCAAERAGRSGGRQRVGPPLVRAALARRAPRLSGGGRAARRARAGRRPRRALAGRQVRPFDHALRSRLPETALPRALPLPQARPHLQPGAGGREVPAPLHGRHDRAAPCVRRAPHRVPGRGRARRRTDARPADRGSTEW